MDNEATDQIGLADLIDTFLQYIWLVIGFFVVAVIIGVVYAIVATPIYRADALVQVEEKKSSALGSLQEIADALGASSSPVSGEVEILRSREVVMKAIAGTRADIIIEPKRFPVIGGWWARKFSGEGIADSVLGFKSYAWGGERLKVDEFTVPEESYGKEFLLRVTADGYQLEDDAGNIVCTGRLNQVVEFKINGRPSKVLVTTLEANVGTEFAVTRKAAVDVYRDILQDLSVAEVGKQSSVIRVSYTDPNVQFARNLVNAIVRAYLTQNVERRSAEADQSLKFLEQQLPEVKQGVIRAEDALNAFRTRTNTVSVEKATDSLLQQAIEAEKARLQLQLKRDELRQRYRPEHPELRAIEAQLAEVEREGGAINEQVNRLPAAQRDLLRLQRDADVSNELYVALLNNAQQLKVAKAGTVGNVRIIDFAVQDTKPVAPKKVIVVAGSALAGMLLGILTAFVARLLRPTVRDIAEVERATGLVAYASIPESLAQERLDSNKRDKKGKQHIIEGRNQLLAVLQPDDPAIESLRSLRTGLPFALMGAANKNIVISGATASLGKSFISANLSVLLASAGKRVLLVETDMRRPQLGAYFGYTKVQGLSDVLAGVTNFDQVVRREEILGGSVDVLPSGQTPPNPGELLLSPAFAELVSDIQGRYDHVIFDSAPILPVGDTLAVARFAATVFMVVRAEQSTVGEVRDAARKLQSAGVAVKGLIFNGIKRRRIGYGYAYKYYYGYGAK
ncbi:MAG: hypothetical protein BGO71_19210 [Burkholderiales bacterium 67-32]|nr:MAG: hypothetical protein BGO71_19210 [Burkholderiales bacterium 67-32]